jgi:hypothetical protein
MKLKEKLAEDWLVENKQWNDGMDGFLLGEYSSFYIAGFDQAREMALAKVRGINPWKENPEELLKNLGEGEV